MDIVPIEAMCAETGTSSHLSRMWPKCCLHLDRYPKKLQLAVHNTVADAKNVSNQNRTNECPGFNGQCCPIGRRGTSSSSIESDTGLAFAPDEIMIPGSDADIFGGNFGGGEDLSIFDNNWDDWTSALHSENEDNLFLASDNSADSYGLTAADFGDLGQWENFDAWCRWMYHMSLDFGLYSSCTQRITEQ